MFIAARFSDFAIVMSYIQQSSNISRLRYFNRRRLLLEVPQVEKVANAIHVDLHYRSIEYECPSKIPRFLDFVEDKGHTSRNHSFVCAVSPLHCECLARSRLPIGEHTHILSVDSTLNQLGKLIEHFLLRCVIKHPLEIELELFLLVIRFEGLSGNVEHESTFILHRVVLLRVHKPLLFSHRSDATVNSDVSSYFLKIVVNLLLELV